MPPTKIRFGISVPYLGANCDSIWPTAVLGAAIILSARLQSIFSSARAAVYVARSATGVAHKRSSSRLAEHSTKSCCKTALESSSLGGDRMTALVKWLCARRSLRFWCWWWRFVHCCCSFKLFEFALRIGDGWRVLGRQSWSSPTSHNNNYTPRHFQLCDQQAAIMGHSN